MNLSAKNLQEAAQTGFKRIQNFRKARLLFIRAFTGQYYNQDHGYAGTEPLNMAFNAVRVLVPNLVTRTPKILIETDFLIYRQYAELLALALNYMAKKLDISVILQRGIVDAIFTMGIFKVGLAASDRLIYFGEDAVDPGQLYIDTVDLDDFTFDPATRHLEEAAFLGEKIRVERDQLLASGLYDNAIIEKLPSSADSAIRQSKDVAGLSSNKLNKHQLLKLHDYIDLLELWLPNPNVLVTLPFASSISTKFLREETFNGPDDGPYSFLSLTPPVPNNPIPVALAGVWHDLHIVSNEIAKKTMDQARAQKDVLGYQSSNADSAQEIVDAENLDAVPMDDPAAAQMFSFGGQNPKNQAMMAQLELWFNQFSGNTNLTGGLQSQATSATEANILQQNAATGITYMRDQVYAVTRKIMRKCAWYLHADPLIELPLIRRKMIPAEYDLTADQIRMVSPAQTEETQVFLTPEARSGDFLDFAFNIEQDSMAPVNWQFRLQQLEAFAVKIIPAAAAASQISAQMGTPFSFQVFVSRVAKMMNISWIDEIFQSPELAAQMMSMAQRGPQPQNSKGVASAPAVRQNNGAVTGKTTPTESVQRRQEAQSGANQGQAALPIREI